VANFNLDDYETVDSRIKRFYEDNPTGRITTELVARDGEIGKTRWVVKASIWRAPFYDREMTLAAGEPDGTGFAFENDGEGMANRTSALENCETSAIGRALANIGYSGDKRASREEMTKAKGGPQQPRESAAFDVLVSEWVEQAKEADSVPALQKVWEAAGAAGVTGDRRMIDATNARKKQLEAAA